MAVGARQRCRLLLEGREVPFISATLMCNPNSPKIAAIDLVPVDVIKFIKPKTQVHIFVQDTLAFGDSDFYLAFEGEVTGRSMSKSQNSRAFQIVATSYMSYMDEARIHFMNPQYLVNKIEETTTGAPSPNAISKAGAFLTTQGTSTATSVMISIIRGKNNKDLVEGVADVFRKLGNVNLFYKLAYDRLRVPDRMKIFTSKNLSAFMKELNIEHFLDAFTGSNGSMTSLLDLLRNLMGLMFHEIIDVPFPSLVSLSDTSPKIKTIGEILFVPDNYSLPPPKCNVVFPNQQISFEFREDFRQSPTRFMFNAQMAEFVAGQTNQLQYPAMYYPDAFSDYMFNNHKHPDNKDLGLLGPSTLLVDKNGRTYADLFYGKPGKVAVGNTSISNRLREQDFLTNDEAVRGIFLEQAYFPSNTTALARGTAPIPRFKFFKEIGRFMFYKSRFQSRNATANLMFHPFLVPGFNCMFVDDSDAGQSFTGKLQSLTHVLTQESAATSVTVGYARNFDEVDSISGDAGDPPTPEWYDPKLFGSSGTTADQQLFDQETVYLGALSGIGVATKDEYDARLKVKNATVFPNISTFFQSLLSCDSVTDRNTDVLNAVESNGGIKVKSALVTPRGAAAYLAGTYRRLTDEAARDAFVFGYVRRPVPRMIEAMGFIGAQSSIGGQIPDEFAEFVAVTTDPRAGRFDGKGFEDERQIAYRRQVIDAYADTLKKQRGFRG
jgi:hypothetical protein